MLDKISSINKFLSAHMFYITLMALILGYSFPIYKSGADLKYFLSTLFALVTFFSSIAISTDEFFQVLKQPKLPTWMLFVVHICTPIVFYFLAILLYPHDTYTRVGMMIASILPMGVSTIIWVSIMGGNIALSIAAVTLDTMVAPFMIAIFIKLFFQEHINIDYRVMLAEMLLMVSVPSILGMLAHNIVSKRQEFYHKLTTIGALFSKLCLLLIVYICVASIVPEIRLDASIVKLMLVVALMVLTSFVLGCLAGVPFKQLERASLISMVYTIGIRNVNFGIIIAVGYFHPAVAIPITLMTLFQQPTAALVSRLLDRIVKLYKLE